MAAVLGQGIYSFSEAARLLGTSYQQVYGWFRAGSKEEPVLQMDYADMGPHPSVSFLDLIDASVALRLKQNKVTPTRIRKLHQELARIWNTEHPFSRRELYVDDSGRRIFSHVGAKDDEAFFEILERQLAMPEVLTPFLKRVEYSPESSLARRLWLNKDSTVLIDPKRSYGKPIVVSSGMPTSILYDCYMANGKNCDFVADWYGVDTDEVREAVAFESTFSGMAA